MKRPIPSVKTLLTPLPLSTIPSTLLRLPPKSGLPSKSLLPSTSSTPMSPTIDKILKSFANKRFTRTTNTLDESRGLGAGRNLSSSIDFNAAATSNGATSEPAAAGEKEQQEEDDGLGRGLGGHKTRRMTLPPNLRIEQFVNKRIEYEGVKAGHRELLQKLRREG